MPQTEGNGGGKSSTQKRAGCESGEREVTRPYVNPPEQSERSSKWLQGGSQLDVTVSVGWKSWLI